MGGIFYAYRWGGDMGRGSMSGTGYMGGLKKNMICKLSYDLNFATQPSLAIRDAEGPYAKLYLIF